MAEIAGCTLLPTGTHEMIRLGLSGAGRIGAVHARNVAANPQAVLVAVADPDASRAAAVAAGAGAAVARFDDMLADRAIDAVIIASPTGSHTEQAVRAVEAGKAVLCEKPLSLNLDEAVRCAARVSRSGAPFMIALNKRFDPMIADLGARVRRGDLGQLDLITLLGKDPAPPPDAYIESSGGIFRDMMIHDIDLSVFLSQEWPAVVSGTGSVHVSEAFARADDFDTAAVTMRTPSGLLIVHTLSRRSSYGFDQRIEAHGAAGMLRTRNMRSREVEAFGPEGTTAGPLLHSFIERYAASYRLELAAFVDAVSHGRRLELDVEHAIRIQAIADATHRAAHEGRAVAIEYPAGLT